MLYLISKDKQYVALRSGRNGPYYPSQTTLTPNTEVRWEDASASPRKVSQVERSISCFEARRRECCGKVSMVPE